MKSQRKQTRMQEPEESDDERSKMHRLLDSLMDGTFSIPGKPSKAADSSYAKDCAPGKICTCAGHLDGVTAYNEMHRRKSRLIDNQRRQ